MEKVSNFLNIDNDEELNEYRRKLYNDFVSDKELLLEAHNEGFSNEEIMHDIAIFSDLKEDRELNKKIKSYEDCKTYNHFYDFKIVKNNGRPEKVFFANKYYQEYLDYMGHFYYKDFSDEFNNIKWNELDNKKAKISISNALRKKKWVYLQGANRSGRTYLSIALTNQFIKSNPISDVAFFDAISRFEELRKLYFTDFNDFTNLMNHLINIEFLVIDNFGSESKDLVMRDKILMPLLIKRGEKENITIFTSNYKIDKLTKLYELKNKDNNGNIVSEELNNLLNSKVEQIIVSSVSLY